MAWAWMSLAGRRRPSWTACHPCTGRGPALTGARAVQQGPGPGPPGRAGLWSAPGPACISLCIVLAHMFGFWAGGLATAAGGEKGPAQSMFKWQPLHSSLTLWSSHAAGPTAGLTAPGGPFPRARAPPATTAPRRQTLTAALMARRAVGARPLTVRRCRRPAEGRLLAGSRQIGTEVGALPGAPGCVRQYCRDVLWGLRPGAAAPPVLAGQASTDKAACGGCAGRPPSPRYQGRYRSGSPEFWGPPPGRCGVGACCLQVQPQLQPSPSSSVVFFLIWRGAQAGKPRSWKQ